MKKLTLAQFSKSVGMDSSTVSRIISGKSRQFRIAKKTEQMVLAEAEKAGFKPNYLAHSLNSGKTWNIGLVFANTIDTFLGSILEGVESHLRGTKYQLVVATCQNQPELEMVEVEKMLYRQVDGIIIYPSYSDKRGQPLKNSIVNNRIDKYPLVIIGRSLEIEADHVLFSDYQAGMETALSFINNGCKRFGIISLPIHCNSNLARENGFIETLLKNGIDKDDIIMVGAEKLPLNENLKRLSDVDCLWAVNSSLLLNYVSKLRHLKSLKPDKLLTTGVEEFHTLLDFKFRSYPMPAMEMGIEAAKLLLARVDGGDKEYRKVLLPWPALR